MRKTTKNNSWHGQAKAQLKREQSQDPTLDITNFVGSVDDQI